MHDLRKETLETFWLATEQEGSPLFFTYLPTNSTPTREAMKATGHSSTAFRSGRSPLKASEREMELLLKRMVHTLVDART